MLNNSIIKILEEAGKILLKYYQNDEIQIYKKSDQSPVTTADLASHDYISSELSKISPISIISEENYEQLDHTTLGEFWILDPLDGTKEFIKKNDEFCICLGLVKDNKPILGFIHDPIKKITYCSIDRYQGNHKNTKYRIALSRSHSQEERDLLNKIIGEDNYEISQKGSALKFCEMALGNIDIYLRFAPCSEWDTAAGQAIIEANNFQLIDLSNNLPLSYNKIDFINNPFIAYHNEIDERIIKNIKEVYHEAYHSSGGQRK